MLKPCIIRTYNDTALCIKVLGILYSAGFNATGLPTDVPSYVAGPWDASRSSDSVLHGPWEFNIRAKPGWARFDGRTELHALEVYLGLIEEFDETPLPHTMSDLTAEETKKKFNLSPDQWDAIPPAAREALSLTEVRTVEIKVEKEVHTKTGWISVSDRLPEHSDTVLVTSDPTDAVNNVNNVTTAYRAGGTWQGRNLSEAGRRILERVTHWAHLPPDLEEVEQEEEDAGPDEEVEF